MPHALGHWVLARADAPGPGAAVTEERGGVAKMQTYTGEAQRGEHGQSGVAGYLHGAG